MKRRDGYILLILSAILLIIKYFILGKVFNDLNSYIIPDDSFYSLLIAKNISLGKGFLYGENFTNGFQPLFVFIMVPAYWIFNPDIISPIYVSLFILTMFSFGSLILIYKLILLIFRNTFAAFMASLLFIITPVSLRNSTNGLETIISFFFFLLCFYLLYKYYDKSLNDIPLWKYFAFGMLLGFALLARIDNIFIFAAVLVFILLKKKQITGQIFFKSAAFFSIGFIIIYLPYLILSYHYTGTLYPVSGKSVRLQADFLMHTINSDKNYFVFMFMRFIRILGSNYLFILSICLIIFIYLFIRNRSNPFKGAAIKEHLPVIIVSILFFVSYTFYIGAHWSFDRYFYPLFIPLIIFTSFLIHKMYLSLETSRLRNFILAGFVLVIFFGNVLRPGIKGFLFDDSIDLQGYFKISKLLNAELPKGSKIGAMQTGAIAYFSDSLRVVNLDGVVNSDAYYALRDKHLIEYIKQCKIDYLVLWDINYQLLAYSSPALEAEDLTFVKIFDSVKSLGNNWYLYKMNY